MKTSLVTLAFASTALAARNVSLPNGWYTIPHGTKISHDTFHGEPRYLTWMADSQMKHGSNPTHDYFVSTLLSGIKMAYDRTQDDKYAAYIENHVNIQLYPAWDGSILAYNNSNSIDDVRFGHTFLDMYNMSGGVEIYKTAAQTLRDQIDRSGRTPDGRFYHRFPTYIDQMWLDGIYMMDVFYARWTHEFEPTNNTAWDDIALQFDLIDAGTLVDRNRTDGLPVHGFDVSKTQVWADPETGAAPHVWGRAVGWYFMALVDTLDYFPEQHTGRARLLSYLHSLADAVVASQDQTYGGWYNVMTPGTESQSGNYIESSGSAMFVYSLFKSLRLGYLSGEKYEDTATSGWELMTSDFARERLDGALAWEWTVQVGSLSSNGTFEYYSSIPTYENDLKGVSPFLFSAYEYELYVEGKN